MFFEKAKGGYILRVRLTPNSSLCRIVGIVSGSAENDYLKITVRSPAEKGKANAELVVFLAKELEVAKSAIKIMSGSKDHWKKVFIAESEKAAQQLERIKRTLYDSNNY